MQPSRADHSFDPPQVTIPRSYNAASDLLLRNALRPDKVSFINATTGTTDIR